MPLSSDTIVAVATPPGRGAIAIVRMSGGDAFAIASRVVRPWPLVPRRATLARVVDPATGAVLERPLVTAFEAPHSYTGEDVVEIATHGGRWIPWAVAAALVASGARQAEPGEFTRRAVLNGRLDLLQAEGVGDLVDATSGATHRQALAQLDGALSRRVLALREEVLQVEALLAYDIDFPEEDDGPVPRGRVADAARVARDAVAALLATAPVGELVREGAVVVIAGPPNAGKSSLLNALIGRARAIVTDVPGTTRDAIEAVVDGARFPLRLVDTAGLRETSDVVERLGIEVSERWLAGAHLVLACGETPAAVRDTLARVARLTSAPALGVLTKQDDAPAGTLPDDWRAVSAERGIGLRPLLDAAEAAIAARHDVPAPDVPLLTRERHRRALTEAHAELVAFLAAWEEGALPAPVAAVHVRAAAHALEGLVGVIEVEEVLGRLFAEFCVGK